MSSYLEFDPTVIDKRQVYRLLTGAVVVFSRRDFK